MGTAWLSGARTVMTCAHLVWKNGAVATSVSGWFGYDGTANTDYGHFTSHSLWVHPLYRDGDHSADLALITLAHPVTGIQPIGQRRVDRSFVVAEPILTIGFPRGRRRNGMSLDGGVMYKAVASEGFVNQHYLFHRVDILHGNSGGPILLHNGQHYEAIAVQSEDATEYNDKRYNLATVFIDEIVDNSDGVRFA